MKPTSLRQALAGTVGGVAILGTLLCVILPVTVGIVLAVMGGGTGYVLFVSGYELLALALVKFVGVGGILVYRYRSVLENVFTVSHG